MKTTVEIGDSLIERARKLARREKITLRELVESGLRRELDERRTHRAEGDSLNENLRRDGRPRPGVDLSDWRQIREYAYGGERWTTRQSPPDRD